MNSFQLVGLPHAAFAPLFALSDAELLQRNAQRIFATAKPGYPCRVSLMDADIGEELLLLPFGTRIRFQASHDGRTGVRGNRSGGGDSENVHQ